MSSVVRFLNPWKFKRQEEQRRFAALRERDGDNCRRCRRPMRFDLPPGRDQGATIQPVLHGVNGGTSALENLCLCHLRCNAEAGDATPEVLERVRRKSEEEVIQRSRRTRKRAA